MNKLMETEPVLTIGMIANLIGNGIALAIAFGAPISNDQREAIISFAGSAFVVISTMLLLIRQSVYSPATHEREKEEVAEGVVGAAAPNGVVLG